MLPVPPLLPAIAAAAAVPAIAGQVAGAFSDMFHAGDNSAGNTSAGNAAIAQPAQELKNITPDRLSAAGATRDDALVHETLRQSAAGALDSFARQFEQALQAAGISVDELKMQFGPDGLQSDNPQVAKFLEELEARSPGIRQALSSLYNNLKALGAAAPQQPITLQYARGRVEVFTP